MSSLGTLQLSTWEVLTISSALKLLLVVVNHSTDFEVHRNWLAITHSTPLGQWYFEESHSEWTLDYPPFFAYFEYILSQGAALLDPEIVMIDRVNNCSWTTVYFQKFSVILADAFLWYATCCFLCSSSVRKLEAERVASILVMVVMNGGLVMIDSMHFQYNGYLLALLILCFHFANQGRHCMVASTFSFLVLSKHLYAPLALPFGVYLLRSYCFPPSDLAFNRKGKGLQGFFTLFAVAISFVCLAFGPFLMRHDAKDQMNKIIERLFPFSRGLVHAYWAPNFWALYSFIDRFLVFVIKQYGEFVVTVLDDFGFGFAGSIEAFRNSFIHSLKETPSLTSGIVGDTTMSVLPEVSATTALILVSIVMLPSLYALYKNPTPSMLIRAVVNCSIGQFMFGYHVHEKAILTALVPLALIAHESYTCATLFVQLSMMSIYSFFPLFTNVNELPLKCVIFILYTRYITNSLSHQDEKGPIHEESFYNRLVLPITLLTFFGLFVFAEIICPSLSRLGEITQQLSLILKIPYVGDKVQDIISAAEKMKFMPLLFTSIICGVVCTCCWVHSYLLLLDDDIEVGVARSSHWQMNDLQSNSDDFSYLTENLNFSMEGQSSSAEAPATTLAALEQDYQHKTGSDDISEMDVSDKSGKSNNRIVGILKKGTLQSCSSENICSSSDIRKDTMSKTLSFLGIGSSTRRQSASGNRVRFSLKSWK